MLFLTYFFFYPFNYHESSIRIQSTNDSLFLLFKFVFALRFMIVKNEYLSIAILLILTNDDGPILSFDTYNSLMHAYATPSSGEYEAKDGDFEFIIMDVQSDLITLKGKRSGNMMYMHRLSKPAKDYIADIQSIEERMASGKYAFVVNGDSILVKRSLNIFTFTDPKTGESTKMHFITTTTGFEFKDSVNIMGKTVTGFTYSENGIWANPADKSVALVALPQPLSEMLVTKKAQCLRLPSSTSTKVRKVVRLKVRLSTT